MSRAHDSKLWPVIAAAALALAFALLYPTAAPAAASSNAIDASAALPVSFAPNGGQTDDQVRYLAQGGGYSFFFTDGGTVLSLAPPGDDENSRALALELSFLGADPDARPQPSGPAEGTVNRFSGPSSDWQSGVATHQELTYRDLWPGIDLVVRGDHRQLTYEFHLDPGADPSDIRLAYAGAEGRSVDSRGDLVLDTALGALRDVRPVTHQQVDGEQVGVDSRFTLDANGRHGFAVDSGYDHGRPLVITTALDYSTFVGGSGADAARAVAVAEDGSTYLTGQTASSNFPVTPGVYDPSYNDNTDAFVTKVNPSGTAIVYSTFLGGRAFDSGNGIAVDDQGAAYVAGFTGSTNYPTTPGAFDPTQNGGSDAFVTKLAPSGSALEYSSYLGASGFAFDGANGIAVDNKGSAYVIGFAGGSNFPVTPGAYDRTHNGRNDVYVTKFNPSGSALSYSTFIGGTLLDTGNGIALDRDGSAYVTGLTASPDFPTTPDAPDASHNGGGNDAFVAKLDSSGATLVRSTFLGGTGNDSGAGIAVDEKGRAVSVTGTTGSADYPTTRDGFDRTYNGGADAFVTRFERSGSEFDYSTFLGGTGSDSAAAVAVDDKGRLVHVTGSTDSADYPTTRSAFDRSYNGGGDAFVTRFERSGSELGYSTFLGGTGSDAGLGLAVDDKGDSAHVVGSTTSADFPVTSNVLDPTYNDAGDGFLAHLLLDVHGHSGDAGRGGD